MENSRRIKVDERLWWAVKTLIKGGSTNKDAAEYFEISVNTVSRIAASETYDEYKQMIAAAHAQYRKPKMRLPEKPVEKQPEKTTEESEEPKPQVIEHKQSITIQATHYMMTELQKTNELLTGISAKLAFIVDELCGVKSKEV